MRSHGLARAGLARAGLARAAAAIGASLLAGVCFAALPAHAAPAPSGALPNSAAPSSGSSVCDLDARYGTPCVAAYSMTRALYASYDGPLYQVQRTSDGTTANVGLLATGGDVNAAEQDSFCAGTECTITELYDQSPDGNNLTVAPGGGAASNKDDPASATALPITIGGHEAYGVDIEPWNGYRNNVTRGVAKNGQPEGMYMVASGTHVNPNCCFDFGNGEANSDDNGDAHMDAVNLTTTCWNGGPCSGSGPWVQADLENGLFMGSNNTELANKGNSSDFVTALLKNNGQTTFALKGGNAQSGSLSTWYNGPLPSGYSKMKQEGGIILGTGGDNSNWGTGSFFEGVMTAGYPSDAADNAVQANIVAAGYAGNSAGVSAVPSAAGPAVAHNGYASVYTVDAASGDLQETYLPAIGKAWQTQDLSAEFGTPKVLAGTVPVAVAHGGYTSVYTVDAASGDLQETFLPGINYGWSTQDLSALSGTPTTDVTPTAVYHDGYTSVYTVDAASGDLQETYLKALGDPWSTQNLSALTGGPAALAGTSPVAMYHSGYTSVYTVDGDHHLQETYLSALGAGWLTQDLSAKAGTPNTSVTPSAVVHSGYASVYTVDDGSQDLQETLLPALGDPWSTQDLSAKFGAPPVTAGTTPVALFHTGYTSVYTVDQGSDDLQETSLPALGDPWATQDLSAKFGTPATAQTPIVLLHADAIDNLTWTSVFTIDPSADLQETYLPALGKGWTTQDLSAKYGTPPS
jgi:Alpha-L-arabinofuranosidase B, catalytic